MPNRLLLVLGLAMVASLLVGGCDREELPEPPPPEPVAEPESEVEAPSPDAGSDAASASDDRPDALPEVELTDLEALIAETAERDQVLVLDFWATWCVPCVAMFPDLHSGLKEMGDAVRPATVTLDGKEEEAQAIAFLAEHNALADAFAMARDSDKQLEMVRGIGERWTDLVVPAILVYDRDGQLAGEFIDSSRVPPILERVRELVEADDAGPTGEARTRAHEAH